MTETDLEQMQNAIKSDEEYRLLCEFAAAALTGMIAGGSLDEEPEAASRSFAYASAMIAELRRRDGRG